MPWYFNCLMSVLKWPSYTFLIFLKPFHPGSLNILFCNYRNLYFIKKKIDLFVNKDSIYLFSLSFNRFISALLVVSLDLLVSQRCRDLLYSFGTWPLYCGCCCCLLHHFQVFLVVSHYGQPTGELQGFRANIIINGGNICITICSLWI